MMDAYKLVVGYNSKQYDQGSFEPDTFLQFDLIEDRSVAMSSRIATQPIQNGDTIADHMYREPISETVSGTFSINGKNWNDDSYSNIINEGDRLTNIQSVFEKIKNEGYLCTLMTLYYADDSNLYGHNTELSRFKIRKNMALESITWTEMLNSMKFSFGFKEIITVGSQETYLSAEEQDKYNLPSCNYPTGVGLGTYLQNTDGLVQAIIQALYDAGYIEDNWIKEVATGLLQFFIVTNIASAIAAVALLTGIVVGKVTAIATTALASAAGISGATSGAIAAAGATASIVPVGTIIAATVAIAVGLAIGISAIVKSVKRAKRLKKGWKYVNNETAMKDSISRLETFINNICGKIDSALTDTTIYSFESMDNHPNGIDTYLKFGGKLYTVTVTKNNVAGENPFIFKLSNSTGETLVDVNGNVAPVRIATNLLDVTDYCTWYYDSDSGYYVYLYNPSIGIQNTEEEILAIAEHLESYCIVVSKIRLSKLAETLGDIIQNAIENEEFAKD